ncbi:MAG: type II toxin-antitoxin system RatA family toxin [Burkholderiales bacterium]|nr:type II toxin-antitoxin system RatA family toxin [Burkholderiales bacterium]
MIVIERSALVERPARRMYELVEGIEAYPEFLPWCSATEVPERKGNLTVAVLHISYHGIRQQFSTENRNEPGRAIDIRLLSGPFRHLQGLWRFESLAEDSCKVSLRLEYDFSNRVLERIAGPVFRHIANTLVDAFVRRANQT